MAAEFNGTCQVCGRQQAVRNDDRIANHGYTVEWGFFNGICQGARELPLEKDKTHTVKAIEWLKVQIWGLQKIIDAGPEKIKKVTVSKYNREKRKYESIVTNVEDLDKYDAKRYQELEIYRLESTVKGMKSHIDMLTDLIRKRHGKDLIVRNPIPAADKVKEWFYSRDHKRPRSAAYQRGEELKARGHKGRIMIRRPSMSNFNITLHYTKEPGIDYS